MGAQGLQFLVDTLVPPINLLNVVDGARSTGAESGKHHGHAGSNIRAGHALWVSVQGAMSLHEYAVGIAKNDARPHEHQLVDEKETTFIHPIVQ